MNSVSFCEEKENLPKVDKEYFKEKKNKILDAAMKVAMRKPVYEVSLKDIILFLITSLDGIMRDIILNKHYHIKLGYASKGNQMKRKIEIK